MMTYLFVVEFVVTHLVPESRAIPPIISSDHLYCPETFFFFDIERKSITNYKLHLIHCECDQVGD